MSLSSYHVRTARRRLRQREVNARVSLVDCCATGFFFCATCQRITEREEKNGQWSCYVCGSHRVKWCPPVPGF